MLCWRLWFAHRWGFLYARGARQPTELRELDGFVRETDGMTLEEFVKLAGGVLESPYSYEQWSAAEKHKQFWAFYTGPASQSLSLYAGVPVQTLFDIGRYSIEHIIPRSLLERKLRKAPAAIRNGATINPFNLAPSHRKLNRARSSSPFDFDGDEIIHPRCVSIGGVIICTTGLDRDDEWVVPERVRGDIARAVLYMTFLYDLPRMSLSQCSALIAWAFEDPPSSWEILYNDWVFERLQIQNPLIASRPGQQAILTQKNLVRTLYSR